MVPNVTLGWNTRESCSTRRVLDGESLKGRDRGHPSAGLLDASTIAATGSEAEFRRLVSQ